MVQTVDMFVPIQSKAEAIRADSHTINDLKTPGLVLMEHAGLAVAKVAMDALLKPKVLVICGKGNNGGDGWVAARHLSILQVPVELLSLCPISDLPGDAKKAAMLYRHLTGLDTNVLAEPKEMISWLSASKSNTIIDAMFGTGLRRELKSDDAAYVDAINDWRVAKPKRCIISADLPSGLFCDGKASQKHVFADHTVTFQTKKIAHVSEPSAFACGHVHCVHIGIVSSETKKYFLPKNNTPATFLIKAKPKAANKGDFAHVGILEGSVETEGAAFLSALAALRSGASLVTQLSSVKKKYEAHAFPELMFSDVKSAPYDNISSLVVGPGLGKSKIKQDAARFVLTKASGGDKLVVLDADGLFLLKDTPVQKLNKLKIIATPHPGEAGKLLGLTAAEIQRDRVSAAKKLLKLPVNNFHDVIWVLKGAYTIVFNRGKMVFVEGCNSKLAIGGSGDVLSGCIAACHRQTKNLFDSAVLGVSMHQAAGAKLALKKEHFLASELANGLG